MKLVHREEKATANSIRTMAIQGGGGRDSLAWETNHGVYIHRETHLPRCGTIRHLCHILLLLVKNCKGNPNS